MDVLARDLGKGVGCCGWTTSLDVALPSGVPEGKFVKVIERSNQRGWGWYTMLTVVTRKGDGRWSIREECFEQRCEYSLDGGSTWLQERHFQVRRALMDLLCREEADLEESLRRVRTTGRLLKRSGGDPGAWRRAIEEIRKDLKVPCGHHKPGSGRDYWESKQAALKKELRRLLNGGVPKSLGNDCEDDFPF